METILYDLDGTLVDHFTTIHRSCAHVAQVLGFAEPSYDKVRTTVGGSVPITLGKLFGPEAVTEGVPLFEDYFQSIIFEDLVVLPGASWILQELHDRGHRQAVFTNKNEGPARAVVDHLGLTRWLDAVVGTGTTPYRKPQPEFTAHAVAAARGAPGDTILIGDSPFDVQAAEAGGLPCHLVATGSHNPQELAEQTRGVRIHRDLFELGESLFGLERPSPHPEPTRS